MSAFRSSSLPFFLSLLILGMGSLIVSSPGIARADEIREGAPFEVADAQSDDGKGRKEAARERAQRYEDLSLFSSVLELVRGNYVEDVDEHALLMSAMRGILEDLDPHSSFMSPDAFEDMQVETKGEFQGLGIEISKEPGEFLEVISPIDGTPAKRAGIKALDRISSICPTEKPADWNEPCRGTMNMSLVEAVALMRGRKGTSISIYVLRKGMAEPRLFEIRRDTVKVASVRSKLVEPGIGHISISSFQERTGRDVGARLADLEQENGGALAGLVLDMRDNPGGLLNQAVEVADHWLDAGLVVYTQGRDEAQRTDYNSSGAAPATDYPIVVLVNEGSASASEIVAGALQDRHRAIVLGVSTFGKGSVQTVYPLEGGAGLRLTTALYYTPAGRSIQEVGITPDLEVQQTDDLEGGLPSRRRVRERDLQGHFTQEEASGVEGDRPAERIYPKPGENGPKKADAPPAKPDVDVQLARAVEVLKSWTYFDDLRRLRDGDDSGEANPQTVAVSESAE
ncbi:MAG: S41 family peptidase [Myxococcota bacterium]